MVTSIFENQLSSLLNFYGFAILELRSRDRESAYLTGVSCGRYSQHGRSLCNCSRISIVDNYEILNNHVFSCTYRVEIIKDIINEGFISYGNVALFRKEIEYFFVLEHCHIIVVVVAHCDLTWVLNLH